ncbi:MAG: hypothetical protein NZ602_06030 [Thermoguttaceae bacterium]|nr:hypothetical protein [Thermoguttaceae bacterium]MDW8038604.1 hypothetical protein [Thermoguttaceae bacterium]
MISTFADFGLLQKWERYKFLEFLELENWGNKRKVRPKSSVPNNLGQIAKVEVNWTFANFQLPFSLEVVSSGKYWGEQACGMQKPQSIRP